MKSLLQNLQFHNEHRAATWLELFFDLIFVVAVSKITHLLAHTHHGHLEEGLWWKFPLMLLPIWWIWMLHTVWNNLYDTDSKAHRAASLFIMLQVIALSAIMTTDWEKSDVLFNGIYFAIRLTFAVLFITHSNAHPKHDYFSRERGIATLIGALISLSCVAFPPPLRYGVFYLGLMVDLFYPLVMAKRGKIPPGHSHHFVERMGLLIITQVIMWVSGRFLLLFYQVFRVERYDRRGLCLQIFD